MKRVLMAVDDSVESLAAARTGARLAAGWNAAVRIITVVPRGTVDPARHGTAERLLAHVARDVEVAGVAHERVDAVVREGEAFKQILEEAHSWSAELIVMAVSNRTGLRSAYVGSQTEHVLEFAECPVLIVPPSAQYRGSIR